MTTARNRDQVMTTQRRTDDDHAAPSRYRCWMHTRLLSPLLMIAFATSSSVADPPRYTRKQTFDIDVKLSKRVKPVATATQPHARALTADEILAVASDNEPLRREQEALLIKLVRDTPDDDPDKPDHMFRLAEHYAKELLYWRLKANAPVGPAPGPRRP